jgi:hypothetical protein
MQYASLRSSLSPIPADMPADILHDLRDAQADDIEAMPATMYIEPPIPEGGLPPPPPPPSAKKKSRLSLSLKRWKSTGPSRAISRPLPPVPPPVPAKSSVDSYSLTIEYSRQFHSDEGHSSGRQTLPTMWTGAEVSFASLSRHVHMP